MSMHHLQCAVCRKEPHEIEEYIEQGKEEGMTPRQFVLEEEGTLNHILKLFACTVCYIKIGMPSKTHPDQWTPQGFIDAD